MLVQDCFLWVLYNYCPIVQDKWSIQTQFICDLVLYYCNGALSQALLLSPLAGQPELLLTSEQ